MSRPTRPPVPHDIADLAALLVNTAFMTGGAPPRIAVNPAAFDALKAEIAAYQALEAAARRCRVCGCTEWNACVDIFGDACHWVEADLCSGCVQSRLDGGNGDRPAPL